MNNLGKKINVYFNYTMFESDLIKLYNLRFIRISRKVWSYINIECSDLFRTIIFIKLQFVFFFFGSGNE